MTDLKIRAIERLEKINKHKDEYECLFCWKGVRYIIQQIHFGEDMERVYLFLEGNPSALCFEFEDANNVNALMSALNESRLITAACLI